MTLKHTNGRRGLAGMALVFSLASICTSAHANAINYPASAGSEYDAGACTYFTGQFGMIAALPINCHLKVPIAVPPGTTIQQINVIYATTSGYGIPFVSASLSVLDFAATTTTVQFPTNLWPPAVDNAYQPMHLMSQFGKNYGDAFPTSSNAMYQVEVDLMGGAILGGIQVIYQ